MKEKRKQAVYNPAALSATDLLALLTSPNVARELEASYGAPNELARLDAASLRRVPGMTETKLAALSAAFELGRRSTLPRQRKLVVRDAWTANEWLKPRIGQLPHEVFHALCLDAKHGLIRDVRVVSGGLTECFVLPREAFAPAIACGASAVLFAHNHPSGDSRPSDSDILLTCKLVDAGKLLGIRVLDHIVVTEYGYTSIRAEGHIED